MNSSREKRELRVHRLGDASICRLCFFLCLFVFANGVGIGLAAAAEKDAVRVAFVDKWSNVFDGTQVKLRVDVAADAPFAGLLRWSYAADERTLARGEVAVQVAAGQPNTVVVPLQIPNVKEHVVFATELAVTVAVRGEEKTLASDSRTIWIYSRDPFVGRTRWLEQLQISLFDPEDTTAKLLKAAGVPFNQIHNLAVLDDPREGLLVIGEDVSFARNRSLAEILRGIVKRGGSVLCLAPREGTFPLPGTGDDPVSPQQLTFNGPKVITELDKRLDADGWQPDGVVNSRNLTITSRRSRVTLEITETPHGWPWLEASYSDGGRLVICGFRIMHRWEDTPTPRFLLARILEHLTEDSK